VNVHAADDSIPALPILVWVWAASIDIFLLSLAIIAVVLFQFAELLLRRRNLRLVAAGLRFLQFLSGFFVKNDLFCHILLLFIE